MPPYTWIHFESALWLLLGGAFVALAVILARSSRRMSFTGKARSDEELDAETHEFGGGVKEQNRPVPLFIWLVVIGYFVWAVAYVLFTAAHGL